MIIPILTLSDRPEDIELGRTIAEANKLTYFSACTAERAREILIDYPQTLIFWDADHGASQNRSHPLSLEAVSTLLNEKSKPNQVFAITSEPLNVNTQLSSLNSFGHHIFRRYEKPAFEILIKLLAAALVRDPFGAERYLPNGSAIRTIAIKESSQKAMALAALQSVLVKQKNPERLSNLVTQAVDELLLNAIFDAPVGTDGRPTRKNADRTKNIVLPEKETVEITLATSENYSCICVADQFGSLKKEVVLSFIRQNFKESEYSPESSRRRGLGLNGIIQSGLSLLFVCNPQVRTEVFLFFPKVTNYKDFRKGFRFLSLLSK